ncbi:MAG TPA: cytidine deaminase [Spirochaetota bacterium]|nr:cytidine deaminase [Spirochaetota bacterium]HOL57032.1 cytidine deaminase [Spirochaetota bacterium]HPP04638.1 cytidine deaminase [Spirochaetota bacterium]
MKYNVKELLKLAKDIANNSYSPYSHFRVGSVILTKNGNIYKGVNVENRSYGATICAERSAISSALTNGENQFIAIAIVGLDSEEILPPCGICRQIISEFGKDIDVIMANKYLKYKIVKISKLLPFDSLHNLKKNIL